MTYSFTTRPGQGARALIPTRYNLSSYALSVEYDDNSNFNSITTGYGTVTYANSRVTLDLSASDVDALKDTFFRIKAVGAFTFYVTDGFINYVPLTDEEITVDLIDSNGYIKDSYLPPVDVAVLDQNVSSVVSDTSSDTSLALRAAFDAQVASEIGDTGTVMGAKAMGTFSRPAEIPRAVRLNPGDFEIGASAPVKSVAGGRWPVWTLRDGVADRINANLSLPFTGRLVDIDVLWANASGTATGNVVFAAYVGTHTPGDGSSAITTLPTVTTQAEAFQYELRRTRVGTRVDLLNAQAPLLMIERQGSNAADTLAADVVVLGALITPVPTYDGILTDDGGACWFNDPRLLANGGKIYGAYVTHEGHIGVSSLTTATRAVASSLLHQFFEKDDHDTPGLVVMGDGRVKAFYSRHSITNDPIYCSTSTNPGDVSAFSAEQTITLPTGGQPCYPKPALIGSRLYVFFRNALNQDFIYSDDGGTTWSTPATLFQWSSGWRGYVSMVQNGTRVDFICNDDNPNASSNCNLYHAYLQNGNVYKTDGTLIGPLGGTGGAGFTTSQLTKIYDYTSDGDAWGWDVQLDGTGKPVCVFATFPGGSSASTADTDHHYKYAYWTGSAWVVKPITSGGPYIPDRGTEYRYSGGIALLSSDTSVVYLSRKVDTQWEIERWTTADQGVTWTSKAITVHSREKQIRPITPEGHVAGTPEVFWQAGWFVTYKQFQTRIVYRAAT